MSIGDIYNIIRTLFQIGCNVGGEENRNSLLFQFVKNAKELIS